MITNDDDMRILKTGLHAVLQLIDKFILTDFGIVCQVLKIERTGNFLYTSVEHICLVRENARKKTPNENLTGNN